MSQQMCEKLWTLPSVTPGPKALRTANASATNSNPFRVYIAILARR
jgi:hypothetical protein